MRIIVAFLVFVGGIYLALSVGSQIPDTAGSLIVTLAISLVSGLVAGTILAGK